MPPRQFPLARAASSARPRLYRRLRILALTLLATGIGAPAADAAEFRLLKLAGANLKWGEPAYGEPARVTYALVAADFSDRDGVNCRAMKPLTALLERAGIPESAFSAELEAAFDLWRVAAGLDFAPVADARDADIVIGAQATPRGIAYTNVHFEPSGGAAVARLRAASICLNPAVAWEFDEDDDLSTYNLRRVLAHEIGHALGLDHPGRHGQLMGYAYSEDSGRLRAGDVSGIRALYGLPAGAAPALRLTSAEPR
jgi:hypothetical protein